jgi:8-oxo-dGTP pyrophosphatase MutT (NUDIX family)
MSAPVEVALAILLRDGQFLMQLRDDLPHILYPGCWGLFGGHMEAGEDPESACRRELHEEIGHCPATLHSLGWSDRQGVRRHMFWAELDCELGQLTLMEGQDLGLVPLAAVERGECDSARIRQTRPLGEPHRELLLDFARQMPQLLRPHGEDSLCD